MKFYRFIQCARFQHDRDEFITSNSFVCSNGKTEVCGKDGHRYGQAWICVSAEVRQPNSDQIVTRIKGHSNIYFQYNGSVYPYHIFLNCKTKLQTILISATRKEFEIGTKVWTKPKIWSFLRRYFKILPDGFTCTLSLTINQIFTMILLQMEWDLGIFERLLS